MNKNLNWINALKAICIICVYFVHVESYLHFNVAKSISLVVGSFYVNAFFFISGYLLLKKHLDTSAINIGYKEYSTTLGKQQLENVIFKIALPTILFSLIEFFPKRLLRHQSFKISDLLLETIGGCTYWFTSALLVAEIIVLLLLFTRKMTFQRIAILGILISFIGIKLNNDTNNLLGLENDIWSYKNGLMAVGLLTTGGLFYKYESLMNKLFAKWNLIIHSVILILLLNLTVGKVNCSMTNMDIGGFFLGLYASVIAVYFCKLLPINNIITFLGRNTLVVYFLSGALPMFFCMLWKSFVGEPSIMAVILLTIFTLAIATITTYLIVKYLPFLVDIRKIVSVPK